MIRNDQQVDVTLNRIDQCRRIVANLRKVKSNPANFRQSSAGFLAEIDRMNLEVREYLSVLPSELPGSASPA